MSRPPVHEKLDEAARLVRSARQLVEKHWEETDQGDVAGLVLHLSALEGELKMASAAAAETLRKPATTIRPER